MKKLLMWVVVFIIPGLCIAQGLPDHPIPEDFYDGGARKAQVDALTARFEARIVERSAQAGDAIVLREKGAGTNYVTIGPIAGTLAANRTFTLPDENVNVKTNILDRIDAIEATSVGGALDDAKIIVGSDANVATARTMSGDATISNTGVLTVPKVGRITLQTETVSDSVVLRGRSDGEGANVTIKSDVDITTARTISIPNADVDLADVNTAVQPGDIIVPGSITVASVDGEDGEATVTITVKDQEGAGMRALVDVWVSDAAFGAVVTQTANLSIEDGDTAILFDEVVANDHYRVLLPANGIGTMTLTGADTGHVVAAVGGVLRSVPFTVTD